MLQCLKPEALTWDAGLQLNFDSHNTLQVRSCFPGLTGRGRTTHRSMERIKMFSSFMLALMPIRFYKPQDKPGRTSNSSRGAALPQSFSSKSFIAWKVTKAGFLF